MEINYLRYNKLLAVMLLFLVVLLSTATGYADRGLSVGVDLGARDFIGRDIGKNLNPGPGADMYMQFGITDVLALKLGMLGSIHAGEGVQNNQNVATLTAFGGMNIGVDFDLIPHAVLQPIIDIGIGGYRLGSNYYMIYNSGQTNNTSVITWGVNTDTGFDYYVNKAVSIGARVSYLYMPVPAVVNGVSKILDGSNIFAGINLAYHFNFSKGGMGMMMPMGCMGMDSHENSKEDKGEQTHK
jgi:hypothetical protein